MSTQPLPVQTVAREAALPQVAQRRRLGHSIWLLLLLREWSHPSDRYVRSGDSIRATEMARALGVGDRQARRELQRLRDAGYVQLENTGRGFRIQLLTPAAGGV